MGKNYFEIKYNGPFKGVNSSLPEDVIGIEYSPYMVNFILKNGEIRTRPKQYTYLPGTPDGNSILIVTSFLDANNVTHTVAVTSLGLWQLNGAWKKAPITSNKTWNLIGAFTTLPGPGFPVASSVFTNKFFWTNGGNNLWMWDGITSIGAPSIWQKNTPFIKGSRIIDSNKNVQVANNSGISGGANPAWSNVLGTNTLEGTMSWVENGKPIVSSANGFSSIAVVDATNAVTAGGYFLIELNSQLLLLNTVEGVGFGDQIFPQRVRWCPSGLPFIWDPNVNIGAGFNDELDVADAITGAFTVGTTAFILRNNGITELTSTGNATNPFIFNHLWASDRGIGNIYPYGYASFGPLGIFISSDDIYNVSLGGFKKIGGVARDSIYNDLALATQNPIGSIVPFYQINYVYNHYRLSIAQGNNNVTWIYAIEDESWQREFRSGTNFTGVSRWSYVS